VCRSDVRPWQTSSMSMIFWPGILHITRVSLAPWRSGGSRYANKLSPRAQHSRRSLQGIELELVTDGVVAQSPALPSRQVRATDGSNGG
jgi:hypothetical protein